MSEELCAAVAAQDLDIIQKLIKDGEDPDTLNAGKYLPLNIAVDLGSMDIIKCLLASNCSVNKHDGFGRLPLHKAAMTNEPNSLDIVRLLLDSGALPDGTDINGETALMTACYWSNADVIEALAAHVSNINYQTAVTERAAIHYAAMREDEGIIGTLLKYGADPDLRDDDRETPLIIATRSSSIKAVQTLLATACQINYQGFMDYTALHWAVYSNNAGIVELLLDNGASVNERNCLDRIPLHIAASCNAVQSVKLLLEAGTEVECMDSNGITPLILAIQMGNSTVVKLLLHANADPDHGAKNGKCNPLIMSLEKMHTNIATDLVLAGCSLKPYWEHGQHFMPNEGSDFRHMAKDKGKLTHFIEQCLKKVNTLQQICRCSIRRHLTRGHQVHLDIQKLHLPSALKHFISMDELLVGATTAKCS